jgi:4-hydroxymandelate oxidase
MTGTTRPPLTEIPGDIVCVSDYLPYARERMSASAWSYLDSGAGDEITLHENIQAFQRIKLLPDLMQSTRQASTQVSVLDCQLAYPLMLAPVAYQRLAHPDGELATVLGASAMQAGMVVSSQASTRLEDIAAQSQTLLWFQLYLQPALDATLALVRRAEAAGYKALVLTLDAPVNGVRNREQRAGFVLPDPIQAANLGHPGVSATARPGARQALCGPLLAPTPTWERVSEVVKSTRLPVLAKGISHARDARRAVQAGCAGIIVSNHGGRVLDTMPATIDLLPGVVAAVEPGTPVLLDGGIRRGTDILKALALGARAVMVGRPYMYGLAAAGAIGVAHVLHILRTELEMAMVLTGRTRASDIDPTVLWPAKGC